MAVINAQGATFTFNSVTVGGIVSFSGFDGAAADIDVTTLASTAKEFRQGLSDEGGFTIELMRDPSDLGQIEFLTARAAQSVETCVLTLPSGDVATFDAYVKSVSSNGGVDGVVTGSAALKVTGPVVWS